MNLVIKICLEETGVTQENVSLLPPEIVNYSEDRSIGELRNEPNLEFIEALD
jgi:hypothetical protein